MPLITALQVFYRRSDTDTVESLEVAPHSQEIAGIKLQVAQMVKRIKDAGNAEYYYVVLKVRRSDGKDGYRTIVPKTLL